MLNIAVVEDDRQFTELTSSYIERFSKENKLSCRVTEYSDGVSFISDYSGNFDVVLMDIEMPHMNGLDTARALREVDKTVCLIFITNMAQYAIKGYEVNALDFVVKPFSYFSFSDKLQRAISYIESRKESYIMVNCENGITKLPLSKILYVEKAKNYLFFHTEYGLYKQRGTMQTAEDDLSKHNFARCISGCLVNLRHVTRTNGNTVWVGEEQLPLSRQDKKAFTGKLIEYLRGGSN